VQQASARHITIVRFLCGLGEQFIIADLYRNAIEFSDHRFIETVFKTRRNGNRVTLYYCRCGEIAVQDEFSKDFVGLPPGGLNRQIERCSLNKPTGDAQRTSRG